MKFSLFWLHSLLIMLLCSFLQETIESLRKHAKYQRRMFDQAVQLARPGGVIVYSTLVCTIYSLQVLQLSFLRHCMHAVNAMCNIMNSKWILSRYVTDLYFLMCTEHVFVHPYEISAIALDLTLERCGTVQWHVAQAGLKKHFSI